MNLRKSAFWGLDRLSGRQIQAQLQDVESLNNRAPNVPERRRKLLEEHLRYVTARVPYYRSLRHTSSLDDFPVLAKEQIRANQPRMLAEGIDPTKLHVASTSGSTGTPFRVYQTREKRRRIDAEAIYYGRLAGYEIGYPLWHLKVWSRRNSRSRLSAFARNLHPIDVSRFGEREASLLLDKISKLQRASSIIAYSSSLETLARVLHNEAKVPQSTLNLTSIVGQSEPLSEPARATLANTLGVYPVGRYGLEETGVLGQQEMAHGGSYRLNLASHVIEVLRIGDDCPVGVGEVGRVVVTDLFNKAQPLVRYDTGDLATVGAVEPSTGFAETLATLEGRSRERLYDVEDNPLTPMIAYNFWWKYPEILQYQIVQRDRGDYLLRLQVDNQFDQESDLVREFRAQVGNSAVVEVEYDASNYQRASGKRQVIVSEYTPEI